MPRHPASHQAGKTAPKRRKDCHSAPACVLSSCSSRRGLDGSLFEPPAAGLHGGSFQRRVREGSPSLSTPHRRTGGVPAAAASSPSRAPSVSFSVSCASAYEERSSGLDQGGERRGLRYQLRDRRRRRRVARTRRHDLRRAVQASRPGEVQERFQEKSGKGPVGRECLGSVSESVSERPAARAPRASGSSGRRGTRRACGRPSEMSRKCL